MAYIHLGGVRHGGVFFWPFHNGVRHGGVLYWPFSDDRLQAAGLYAQNLFTELLDLCFASLIAAWSKAMVCARPEAKMAVASVLSAI